MKITALPAVRSLRVLPSYHRPVVYLSRPLSPSIHSFNASRIERTQWHQPVGILTRSFAHGHAANYTKNPDPPDRVSTNSHRTGRADDETPTRSVGAALPAASTVVVAGGGLTTGNGMLDALITTAVGLVMVFVGGIAYVAWYKANVLDKIELAFTAGYDPALELANRAHAKTQRPPAKQGMAARHGEHEDSSDWWEAPPLRRDDQDLFDNIVSGHETGRYFMILGPKGTGKTTMLLNSMREIHAEGVSLCDAHPDLEVFRLRLGKALNYEYHEDSQTGLFQRRDPREGGAALDIERALNKLEKVGLRYSQKRDRPLVLIINNIHFFRNDDAGRDMLLQLQQHAEAWAASGVITLVFSSDDAWPYMQMRKSASRMRVISVQDLKSHQAWRATRRLRFARFAKASASSIASIPLTPALPESSASEPAGTKNDNKDVYKEVVAIVGGRLSYLVQAATHTDMLGHAEQMLAMEKAWLQSQIGLIPDHDDDVMDEQKWSSCSWLLLREFVKMRQEQEKELQAQIDAGEKPPEAMYNLPLPQIPYYKCREIMTRPDFLEDLDRSNIIAIDINHNVTPDSLLLLRAAREVVEGDDFDQTLDDVRDRVDEIESLHRTRELTFKDIKAGDRIRLSVDKGGALLVES